MITTFFADILGLRYRFGDENDGLEAREETLRSVAVPDATQGRRETTQTEETGSSELQSLLFIASDRSTSCIVVVVMCVCMTRCRAYYLVYIVRRLSAIYIEDRYRAIPERDRKDRCPTVDSFVELPNGHGICRRRLADVARYVYLCMLDSLIFFPQDVRVVPTQLFSLASHPQFCESKAVFVCT